MRDCSTGHTRHRRRGRPRQRMPAAANPSFGFFFNDTATTEIYTLSLHDALPIQREYPRLLSAQHGGPRNYELLDLARSEEHTSELQSLRHLVCRLLLEKKKQ